MKHERGDEKDGVVGVDGPARAEAFGCEGVTKWVREQNDCQPNPTAKGVDAAGRRYRAVYDAGEVVAWSLLDDNGPALWWTRQGDGGILSRRGGEQYRWTRVVTEPSNQPLREIIPEGFTEGVCSE